MNTSDMVGIVIGALTLYFIWRQNQILKQANELLGQQNEIFAKQQGKRGMSLSEIKSIPRIKMYWPMLAMTVLTLLTWGAIGYSYYYQHFVVSSISTSVRMGPLQFTTIEGKASAIKNLEPNKPVAMNLGVINHGPLPAVGVGVTSQIKWLPELTKSEEDDAWDDFRKTTPIPSSIDLDVGDGSWKTYNTQTLSSNDIKDIGLGRKVLYMFMYYEYRDNGGNHSTSRCEYLPTSLQETIVWANCKDIEHNKIK